MSNPTNSAQPAAGQAPGAPDRAAPTPGAVALSSGPADYDVVETDFGRLIWRVSAALANSTTMTVGECVIEPGKANGRHYHPNCDEVLYVADGHIRHTADDLTVEMRTGDIISIPAGVVHNARNLADSDAHLFISFSSAHRESIGVDH